MSPEKHPLDIATESVTESMQEEDILAASKAAKSLHLKPETLAAQEALF